METPVALKVLLRTIRRRGPSQLMAMLVCEERVNRSNGDFP